MPGGGESKTRRRPASYGEAVETDASNIVSGAWMKVIDGKLKQVTLDGFADYWAGDWEHTDPKLAYEAATDALTLNLSAAGVKLAEVGSLRVVE